MSPRPNDEREQERLEREARRAARAERVEAALARSRARRDSPQFQPPTNGSGRLPPQRRRRRRFLVPVLVFVVLVCIAAAWFLASLYQPGKGVGTGRTAVVIPRGSSLGVIAGRLDAAGVIANPFF